MARDEDDRAIVLRHGVSFATWKASLNGALARHSLLGYVHKNMHGIPYKKEPVDPGNSDPARQTLYLTSIQGWIEGNCKAVDIIIRRLDKSLQPFETDDSLTASDLYESIVQANRPSIMNPFHEAWTKFLATKFRTTADQYCTEFQRNLQGARSAAASAKLDFPKGEYDLGSSIVTWLFYQGTIHIPWLDTWRVVGAVGAPNKGVQFASLEEMMATLRSTAGQRRLVASGGVHPRNVTASAVDVDPDADCTDCRTKSPHKNKRCWKKYPDQRPENQERANNKDEDKDKRSKDSKKDRGRSKSKGKGKSKGAAATPQEDTSSSSDEVSDLSSAALPLVMSAKSSDYGSDFRLTNDSIIYDTGSSRHFIRKKSLFDNLTKLDDKFHFSQAVSEASLSYEGTAILQLGNYRIKLRKALYSPRSTCSLLSAGRLQRIGGVYQEGAYLVKRKNGDTKKIARLVPIHDVLIIRPLINEAHKAQPDSAPLTITAPAVTRLSATTDAQRWHQRLGHVGAKILSKTKALSRGLENVDTTELALCRTCHLSKAQRTVSRDPRPLPSSPLDEVFIDVVGPVEYSVQANRWATVVTDAKTRYRWAFGAPDKSSISIQISQLIRQQQHQYGKIVKLIFSDGGTEIQNSVIKDLAMIEGIRLDKSAAYTPEQNGLSESSNKVVVTRARSMLIDAGLPPAYWEHALQHACFITNRLYNLTTKKVPHLDFLQGLNQPHKEQIDLKGIPRFGCKAFKYIDNHTGKFTARAVEGWFMGYQPNTSTNYNILALHQEPQGRVVWKMFITPHVSFDEDCLMGPELFGP
jgi:hypothetical protein